MKKETAVKCDNCGTSIKTNSESGVDVLLTVEMIKHAAMREHEYLALVSSDRDFVPLLTYLRDQGQRVLHIATSSPDQSMRSVTWKQVDLRSRYVDFCSIRQSGYLVLTSPSHASSLEELLASAPVPRGEIEVIDVTDAAEFPDADLNFLFSKFRLSWKKANSKEKASYEHGAFGSLHDFRTGIRSGDIAGPLPLAIKDGVPEIAHGYGSGERWIAMSMDANAAWPLLRRLPAF